MLFTCMWILSFLNSFWCWYELIWLTIHHIFPLEEIHSERKVTIVIVNRGLFVGEPLRGTSSCILSVRLCTYDIDKDYASKSFIPWPYSEPIKVFIWLVRLIKVMIMIGWIIVLVILNGIIITITFIISKIVHEDVTVTRNINC